MFHLNLLLFKWTLAVFVESLESLCENHNVSFNVDSGCYSSLQKLNLTKAISDQLKYIILLKLAMLELPCCSIVLSYLSQHTLKVTGHPFWRFVENRYCALKISPIFTKC